MATLYLIDGASYLYRAYHALPPLTAPDGHPTGAMYGVLNMLRRLDHEAAPAHIAFVFDAPGPTFREAIDPNYKATRPPMPDALKQQVEPLLELVEASGIPVLIEAGVEADDVIATLTRQARAAGMEVVISTSDKDLTQLVGPGITWVNTMTGERLDRDGVIAKFGVPPERIVDFLTLTGDAIDNVPGVEGCGPKTAAKWLAQYGDLEGVIAHAGEIKGKIGEKLRAAAAYLPRSRLLVTVKDDCALPIGPGDLLRRAPDRERLIERYQRYGFNPRHLPDAAAEASVGPAEPASVRPPAAATAAATMPAAPASEPVPAVPYALIQDEAALADWAERLARAELIAFDTETTSLDPMRAELVGLALATAPGEACYIPVGHRAPGQAQLSWAKVRAVLGPLLTDPHRPKLAHHGKYDLHVLARHGLPVHGLEHDSMLESYVLNSTLTQHNLDALAAHYLGHRTIKYEEVTGKGARQIGFADVDLATACAYAAEDADVTLRLHRRLWPELDAEPALRRVYREIEIPLIPVLQRMEAQGVLLDVDELRRQSQWLGQEAQRCTEHAHRLAGRPFSLDSTKQLAQVLYTELNLPIGKRTPGGAPSTDEEALEALTAQHELPRVVLEYRALAKLKSTYTDKLPALVHPHTGRLHTSYHQAVAATGRLSSSDPNLQNIPIRSEAGKRIRRAFVAPPGYVILAADYSQIELRIMAHLSQDPGLLGAFARGEDVHRATAAEIFGVPTDLVTADQRRTAKVINFGLIYGMSAFGLARNLGIPREEAKRYVDSYFARYPGVQAYMERTRAEAHARGYVETVFGRRLYLNEIGSRQAAARAGAERAAINAPMQGTAADIIKRAMLAIDAWLVPQHDRARMLLQVHDELVFEVRADALDAIADGVRERMAAAAELSVPLVVDLGHGANWGEAHG